jgi:hypothetical protein
MPAAVMYMPIPPKHRTIRPLTEIPLRKLNSALVRLGGQSVLVEPRGRRVPSAMDSHTFPLHPYRCASPASSLLRFDADVFLETESYLRPLTSETKPDATTCNRRHPNCGHSCEKKPHHNTGRRDKLHPKQHPRLRSQSQKGHPAIGST